MPKAADLYAELGLKKDKFDKGMKDAEQAPGRLNQHFSQLGAGIAAAFSVGAIIEFTRKSIAAYDIQAKADASLLQALNGRKDIQQELIKQAGELQGTTLFGDEGTVEAQKQLAVMGLTKTQIMDLIPLIQDFATVKQMDLKTAAEMVAKSIGTESNALKRSGIDLEGFTTKSEKAAEVARVFNERYGGQAVVAARAGTGAMEQAGNAAGELAETFGKLVATNTSGFFSTLTRDLLNLNDALNSDAIPAWKKFFGLFNVGMQNEIKMQAAAAKMFDEAQNKEMKARIESLDALKQSNDEKITAVGLLKTQNEEAIKQLKIDNEANRVKKLEEENKRLKDIRDSYRDINDGILKMNESLFQKNPFMKSIDARPTSTLGLQGGERNQFIPDFDNAITEAEDKAIEFMDSMNQSMQQFTADFIGTFAEGIGQLMSGNIGLDQFFNSILGAFGGFISQMGKMLIAYGIGMEAFKKAFTNPFAAIAAGIALTVIGGLISGLASKGPSMSGSTGGMSGGGYSSGGNTSYGGGTSGGLVLSTEISGDRLRILIEQSTRKAGRKF